jgi:transcriptional regulator with XRE-family HTH domain
MSDLLDVLNVSASRPKPRAFLRVTGAELGAVIRARRKARGLTILALAGKAGIDRAYLSKIEYGYCTPGWGKVSDLAEVLNVPMSVLAREAEDLRAERLRRSLLPQPAERRRQATRERTSTRTG